MNKSGSRGFTLVELVLVIVITGILAATLVIFLKPAVDSYVDTRRRAEMSDIADTALRRMAQDIRSAVPNSVRAVSASCFQLVPTIAGGRYRMAPDTNQGVTSKPIDPDRATSEFDVLSPLADPTGNWVVIDNQNADDVYTNPSTGPRARITGFSSASTTTEQSVYQHRITLEAPGKQFPPGYEGGRFVIVPNDQTTVFYSWNSAARTLYRGNTNAFARLTSQAGCDAAGGQIVATGVEGFGYDYDANQGRTQQSGYVSMRLELRQDGESVALFYGVHVDNFP